MNEIRPDKMKKIAMWGVLGVALLFSVVLLNPFTIVAAGHRGIVLNFSAVQPDVLGEGVHFRIPIMQRIVEMSVQIQKAVTKTESASKDLQQISTTIALNYHLDPEAVNKIYQEVGLRYKSIIIDPAIQEIVKSITAKYSAEQLITKRPEVAAGMRENFTGRLKKHYIIVDQFAIEDFNFSDEFNAAIEKKQRAEQEALTAKNEREKAKFEADKVIAKARGEAESLRQKRQQITPLLLKLRELEIQEKAIQKWNGDVPTYMVGKNPPFLGKIIGQKGR